MTIDVHPVADLFPMMAADELAELAADIKARGLLHPIVLDTDGRILDGRNRYAACELARVEAEFTIYDGHDPDGYALAANGQRRDLTKSKRAVIAGRAKSLVTKEWGGQSRLARILQVSEGMVSQVQTILKYTPALADAVLSGAMGLDAAYEKARQAKDAAEGEAAQLERLRAESPELADKVVEGDLSLKAAQTELAERQRKRAEEQRDARALLTRILDLAAPPAMSEGFVDSWAAQIGEDLDHDLIDRTEQAAQVLSDLAKRIRP